MTQLLIEIYSEEIPARMQPKAMENFERIFVEFFEQKNIKFNQQDLQVFITPRRLSLLVKNLDEKQISPAIDKIGPKVGAPDKAVQGFLRSTGLGDVGQLEVISRDNGDYYFYKQPEVKIKTSEILQKNLPALLQKMAGTWPKTMDLIDLQKQSNWVRPIRNILAVFGNKVIDFEFANLKANNQTFGHLLYGKKTLKITDIADYEKKLEENLVILNWHKRRDIIVSEINKLAAKSSLKDAKNLVDKNKKLIDEITGLVEYPQILIGKIDEEFANLPDEILELTIKLHQKAILIYQEEQGKKLPFFIFVSNIKTDANLSKKIIADNEKTVRARLRDAKFYIEEDLKTPFRERANLLRNIVFHKKLGSLYHKGKRLDILDKFIALWVPRANFAVAEILADYAKNDLSTKMVAELPELQGVVGSYYAKMQGEPEELCQAIAQQYLPVKQDGQLPHQPLSIVLAMADKIDNICSLFLADEKPTASKDPFALRRAALGIIKILFENKINLPLRIVVDKAINTFPLKVIKELYPDKNSKELKEVKKQISSEIIQFFIDRNKAFLKDQYGLRIDIINQVFEEYLTHKDSKKCDLLAISQKAVFINEFIINKSNANLIELYKRAANIVNIEEKKDETIYDGKVSLMSLKTKYERLLYKKVRFAAPKVKKALKSNDYEKAFAALLELEFPIKSFFDNVAVNCEDNHLRINRLLILSKVRGLFNKIFNFSKIEISVLSSKG